MPSLEEIVAASAVDRTSPQWRQRLNKPPLASFDPGQRLVARIATNKGVMGFRLLHDSAPMHVTSFAYLARIGFYDGLAFHRVITGFMAQGGCPKGDGTGGPGYRYDGEYRPGVGHDRPGLLSTANAGPGTDGSQFFITFAETPWLDGKHTIFGAIETGQDVLKWLEAAGSETGAPRESVRIASVVVEAAG